jgi:AraC-like DNA-binding protein
VLAGDVLILSEGSWCAADPIKPTEAITLYIDPDFLRANARWIPPRHPLAPGLCGALTQHVSAANVRFEANVMRALTPALKRMAHATNHPEDPYSVIEASISLFAHIARQAQVEPDGVGFTRLRRGGIVARAMAQVMQDLDRRWSVADLASTVAISGSQLTRLFRDELGTSPAAFVREQRISEMARLLSTGVRGIAEAARQVGWPDASSASRAFRRRYGVSPRVYRDRSLSRAGSSTADVLTLKGDSY